MVGGYHGDMEADPRKVEALTTDGTPLCTLPDLPDDRISMTMDNNIMCGGYFTKSSCLYFVDGEWTKYRIDLETERSGHVSWQRPDGEVILIGGEFEYVERTSEVVSSSGHRKGFTLQHGVL